MLREYFLGRRPSHFQISPIVKAYIVAESLLWSAWDFVIPIFALFVVKNIVNGDVKIAASGYSIYLISRVIFELISGKFLSKSTDREKILMTILGMLCLSFSYAGFAFSHTIISLFFFYFIIGIGLGIASPAKNSLFAIHLDKNKESTEWSLSDGIQFTCMASATALGGFIASIYGFQFLFLLAGIVNLLGTIPYLLYLW